MYPTLPSTFSQYISNNSRKLNFTIVHVQEKAIPTVPAILDFKTTYNSCTGTLLAKCMELTDKQ